MKNNLVDELFDKSKDFRMAVLCTYGLSVDFLENYLLNLDSLVNCSNLCIFTDRSIYNNLFESTTLHQSKWINKRYLLTPIDTNGLFHPKLYILASDKSIRIGIGSANLTREGLATNLEITSVFEITKKDKKYLGLLIECIAFMQVLAEKTNSKSAISYINNFIDYINHFLDGPTEKNIQLFHNLNQKIATQISSSLKDKTVTKVEIISPFFDKDLKALKWLNALLEDVPIYIFIQQGKTNFPVEKYRSESMNTKLYIYDKYERYIHGKAIIFTTNDGNYVLTGSANFTDSALLSSNYSKNIETMLWGMVDKEVTDALIKPNGYKPILLKDIEDLSTTAIQIEEDNSEETIIADWLIEVALIENKVSVILRDKAKYLPKKLFFNGNQNKSFDYAEEIDITGLNKSEIDYAQVSGFDLEGRHVESGKIWLVNLSSEKEIYNRKRYTVNEPSQLVEILKDLVANGTEEELIDYILKFNIPLDLTGLNLRSSGLKAMESKGNIFGELVSQNASILNYPSLIEALDHFLNNNFKKLSDHLNNVQLLKLNNFILIFSTMFSMMNIIHENIIATNRKKVIEADQWSKMRYYYDMFLRYSKKSLELLWLTNDKTYTYAEMVDIEIDKDEQNMLGKIKSFEEFIIKMGYDYYFFECYGTVKNICKYLNIYIRQGKVKTIIGEIKPLPISSNGMRDSYILKRDMIYNYVDSLEDALKNSKLRYEAKCE